MFFRAFRVKRAAQQYAALLPFWLAKAYGPHEFYTEAQLRRAVLDNRLNDKFIGLAFANFLSREQFEKVSRLLPVKFGYDEARDLFRFAEPVEIRSRAENFPSINSDAYWGAPGDH